MPNLVSQRTAREQLARHLCATLVVGGWRLRRDVDRPADPLIAGRPFTQAAAEVSISRPPKQGRDHPRRQALRRPRRLSTPPRQLTLRSERQAWLSKCEHTITILGDWSGSFVSKRNDPVQHCTFGSQPPASAPTTISETCPWPTTSTGTRWIPGIRRAASEIADHRVGGRDQRAETA